MLLVLLAPHCVGLARVVCPLPVGPFPAAFGTVIRCTEAVSARAAPCAGPAETRAAAFTFGHGLFFRVPPDAYMARPSAVTPAQAVIIPRIQFILGRWRRTALLKRWLTLFDAPVRCFGGYRPGLFLRCPVAFSPFGILIGA